MSAVTSVAGYFKKHVLGQSLIRRNPFFYDRACADLDEIERLDVVGRRAWVKERVAKTLELAAATFASKRRAQRSRPAMSSLWDVFHRARRPDLT